MLQNLHTYDLEGTFGQLVDQERTIHYPKRQTSTLARGKEQMSTIKNPIPILDEIVM